MPLPLFGAVLLAALTATGCTFASEGKYDWHQGWSEATVVRIGNAAALDGRYFSDCRFEADAEQVASGQFVVLSYEQMGRTRHRVVPLRQGEAYRPGDLVYMNLNSCHTPLVARTRTVRE
jgi:hypothetical protein